MNPDAPKPPSLGEFDYFADREPVALADVRIDDAATEELHERVELARRLKRRIGTKFLSTSLLLGASVWVLWGLRDEAAYVFRSPQQPRRLGPVTAFGPGDIPHNAYVEIEGITEHRGLVQHIVRGLWPKKEEFWYFRLLGSQGVFVEVPADAERYGKAVGLKVSGRAVDPSKTSLYGPLLREYTNRFHPADRPALRIVQVGVAPGEGRWPYVALFAFVLILSVLNMLALRRLYEVRRELRLGEGALLR